ncbi:unnamed protein product [Diatraea saccharalis]|uniref:Cation/H+ exchanger transmembrane domain-containing protein n=1 Tax=Diatraea saccharalis TaxID=40085 RepID=A0A9N9R9G5_9NEOP|nr:unnamed protein product [Diatraea saccharalis]
MFCLGGLVGFCANKYPAFKPFVWICYMDVDVMMTIFLPILMFNTSYTVDSHAFWKSFPQIVLVGVPGALLTALLAAFMAYYLIESSWNLATSMLFGIICSPIYPMEVVQKLKEMSKGKYISVLLLGEGLIGDATTMIAFTAVYGYLAMALTRPSQIALLLVRLLVYTSMTPILRHVGYGMTWQLSLACVWGGLRGPLTLCLAVMVLQTPAVADAGEVNILRYLGG